MQTRSWIAVATSLALLNGQAFAQSGDTAMFRGDLAHRGVYTSPTGRSTSEAGTVGSTLDATTGTLKTGEGFRNSQPGPDSSASVFHGIVYFGCRDSNLYAV